MNLNTTMRSKIIAVSFIALITTNNVQSMEEECTPTENIINSNNKFHQTSNIVNNINDDEEERNNDYNCLANLQIHKSSPKFSIDNIIHNSVISNSAIRKIIRSNINTHPADYTQQKLEGISIINNREYDQKYEKFLFSIDDSNTLMQDNIKEIEKDIDTVVKDVILDRYDNNDSVLYKNKIEEEKINTLCKAIISYYNGDSEYCVVNQYDTKKRYIPFKLLQIMYNSIKKYDIDIAYKTINKVYNENKDTVHNFFKEIYNSEKFDLETNKKNMGFLGSYNLNHIPNHKELNELQGKELADYWEYANRSTRMFPSINVHYTDEYLKEAYKRWSNNIQYDLNNIIEKSTNNKPIDNILNYYARVANRSPNIYLSNDVIDFIHKKLGIDDVIYFIDKFIKIKQQYLTEDDLPQSDHHNHPGHPHDCPQNYGNFHNSLNEYPNGNIKEYKVNIYNQNCIVCIFKSSDKYGNAGENRIIINNEKEELYNRLMDANTTFNLPKWHINKYSRVNYEGNKEYNTLFLYYVK